MVPSLKPSSISGTRLQTAPWHAHSLLLVVPAGLLLLERPRRLRRKHCCPLLQGGS